MKGQGERADTQPQRITLSELHTIGQSERNFKYFKCQRDRGRNSIYKARTEQFEKRTCRFERESNEID